MGQAGVMTRFALTALAVWRVTHLLAAEDGPARAVLRLRVRLGDGSVGEVFDCFYCLSVWIAAPASLAVTRRSRELPVVWLALSGSACLLERATSARGAETATEARVLSLPRSFDSDARAAEVPLR